MDQQMQERILWAEAKYRPYQLIAELEQVQASLWGYPAPPGVPNGLYAQYLRGLAERELLMICLPILGFDDYVVTNEEVSNDFVPRAFAWGYISRQVLETFEMEFRRHFGRSVKLFQAERAELEKMTLAG